MIETGVYFKPLLDDSEEIGVIHSFKDLNLILSSYDIPPAKPKVEYVEVPGADGALDMTEANGVVRFYDRTISFVFTMLPTDPLSWEDKKRQVSNALNGKRFEQIILDKDANYFYSGRCTVDSYESNKKLRQIVVKAQVSPYKLYIDATATNVTLTLNRFTNITLTNDRKPVIPNVRVNCGVNEAVRVWLNGTELDEPFTKDTTRDVEFCLLDGDNDISLYPMVTKESDYYLGVGETLTLNGYDWDFHTPESNSDCVTVDFTDDGNYAITGNKIGTATLTVWDDESGEEAGIITVEVKSGAAITVQISYRQGAL